MRERGHWRKEREGWSEEIEGWLESEIKSEIRHERME